MTMTMNVAIPEGLEEQFVAEVARLSMAHAEARINKTIDAAVAKAMSGALEATITERVAAETNRVMDEGWPQTDSYGNKKGTHTLKSMVLSKLTSRDSYSSTNPSKVIEKTITEALKKELKPELEKARQQFREKVDETLNAQIQLALRQSLGLGS